MSEGRTFGVFEFIDIMGLLFVYSVCAAILWLSSRPSFYYLEWVVMLALAVPLVICVFRLGMNPTGRRRWKCALITTLILPLLISIQIPLRLAFLTIRPGLKKAIGTNDAATFKGLNTDITSTLFQISAANTNARLERNRGDGNNTNRVLFILSNDRESAFIFSPGGLKDLVYNSGSCGHLIGDWYWMVED